MVGLGFHGRTSDYRIVRIVYDAEYYWNFVGGGEDTGVEVFSLRRNTWEEVKDVVVPRVPERNGSVFVDGMIYWLGKSRISCNRYSSSRWLVFFDVNNEVFGDVECPDILSDWVGRGPDVNVMEYKGSVSICVSRLDAGVGQKLCVWVMHSEGGAAVSWTKVFDFDWDITIGYPLKLTWSGKLIMAPLEKNFVLRSLVSCDLNKGLEVKSLGNLQVFCTVDTFIESMVLLDEGTALSRDWN